MLVRIDHRTRRSRSFGMAFKVLCVKHTDTPRRYGVLEFECRSVFVDSSHIM